MDGSPSEKKTLLRPNKIQLKSKLSKNKQRNKSKENRVLILKIMINSQGDNNPRSTNNLKKEDSSLRQDTIIN